MLTFTVRYSLHCHARCWIGILCCSPHGVTPEAVQVITPHLDLPLLNQLLEHCLHLGSLLQIVSSVHFSSDHCFRLFDPGIPPPSARVFSQWLLSQYEAGAFHLSARLVSFLPSLKSVTIILV
jgi:hypothetical protein